MPQAPKPLKARIVPVSAIEASDRAAMFSIFQKYYADVSWEKFLADFSKKDSVILLLDRADSSIRGFSTLAHLRLRTSGGREVRGAFSGDTIIEHDYWGGSALQNAFLKHLWLEKLRHPFGPYYWFLISKGYKTYLLMANNFREHYPRYEHECPADRREIIAAFSTQLFGDLFQPSTGLIGATADSGRLRLDVAPIEEWLIQSNPRVAFFEQVNPTWKEGTELACIARMGWWTPFRYILKTGLKVFSRKLGLASRRKPQPESTAGTLAS